MTRGGGTGTKRHVKDLQLHLRSLGYLRRGIDGLFGPGTERSVKALQHDLLYNHGEGKDGDAPVAVADYNKGREMHVNGEVGQGLAGCIADMINHSKFPTLPFSEDPRAANHKILEKMASVKSDKVPVPFVLAILKQESNLQHFHVPRGDDEDSFIVVGLDTNASDRNVITSRGYGAGQYTLFHHPPKKSEVREFMLDADGNLEKAMDELNNKFEGFVNGSTSGTRADDRIAEIGKGKLRPCRYKSNDPRCLRDCRQCLRDAGTTNIRSGVTRLYPGSLHTYLPTRYYRSASYEKVPQREKVGCDWPYAVRRYNGAGTNSYHYQTRVLLHLLKLPEF